MLTRRSPLVILICLELMLNAGNLALSAFARMTGTGDGQVFALIVMIVAACRGRHRPRLIVAMYRNRLPMDVDEMTSCTDDGDHVTAGSCSAFPLAGSIVIALGFRRWPGRSGRAGSARPRSGSRSLARSAR